MTAAYDCPNCGAGVMIESTALSTMCAFCDTSLVPSSSTTPHPDLIAKFVITRHAAAQRLSAYLAGAWFLAPSLKRCTSPTELNGVYVPFWLLDASVQSSYQASIGIHWQDTERYTTTENGKTVVKTRTVTRTDWHPLSGEVGFEELNHLVCGSTGIPRTESSALEPFDVGQCLPYESVHHAGWVAERFTLAPSEGAQQAAASLRERLSQKLRSFLPGDEHRDVRFSSQIEILNERTVLLPIWTAVYTHKGSPLRLLVNGQTGEVVGALPRDWLRITLVLCSIFLMVGLFLWGAQ